MSERSYETKPEQPRAALVAVQLPDVDNVAFASSVAELNRLAKTLGVEVVATVTQRRAALHAGTVVGSGKLASLRAMMNGGSVGTDAGDDLGEDADDEEARLDGEADPDDEENDGPTPSGEAPQSIDAVLVDHEVTPSQARNLEKATGAEVMDRTAVILEISTAMPARARPRPRSRSCASQYMAPRLREQGKGRGPPAGRHRRQGSGRVEPGAGPPQDSRPHRRADRASSPRWPRSSGRSGRAAAT